MTRITLIAFVACTACSDKLHVAVVGSGVVFVQDSECRSSCDFLLSAPVALRAEPDDGWLLSGFEGGCTGQSCSAMSGSVTVRFVSAELVVEVEGPGVVRASDGEECSQLCRWSPGGPLVLTGVPSTAARFIGFSGVCNGQACVAASGRVKAEFELLSAIDVEIDGDGSGSVSVAGQQCSASCTVPASQPTLIDASPGFDTIRTAVAGSCLALPCTVTPPARVVVTFERGRLVRVVSSGRGAVNVGATSCASSCEYLVARDAGITLRADEADDYAIFTGWDGGGCGVDRVCDLMPSIDDVSVEVRFEDALFWYRSYDAVGQAFVADDQGLVFAGQAGGMITVDGMSFAVSNQAAPEMAFATEVHWDAGSKWVRAFNGHQLADRSQQPAFRTVLRRSSGEIFVAGSCMQGRLNGVVNCDDNSTPIVIRFDPSGTLASFIAGPEVNARFSDAFDLSGRLYAFRGIGSFFGGDSAAIVEFQSDGGISTVLPLPAMYAFEPGLCSPTPFGLRCILNTPESLLIDDCMVAADSLVSGVLVEFDASLRCAAARRLFGTGEIISNLSNFPVDGGAMWFFGRSGPADFGNGLTTTVAGMWVAQWAPGALAGVQSIELDTNVTNGTVTRAIQMERVGELLAAQTTVVGSPGFPTMLWGSSISRPVVDLSFFGRSDPLRPVRRWQFTDANGPPMQLVDATRFFVANGKLAILVTGTNVRFGPTQLANDGRRKTHLVVLRTPN
ncbi:MAG: hypothetical protein JNM17_36000 [Archangium sp.]|nr:hypothetical protein [Archangium sp.]